MEQNNEEMQIMAVEKVLDEMQYAENILMRWNAHWWQSYDNILIPEEYYSSRDQEEKYRIIGFLGEDWWNIMDEPLPGKPLKTVSFKYNYIIYKIDWLRITTNNCTRKIQYSNNGDIFLSKEPRINKKTNKVCYTKMRYTANYNVLLDDFNIDITIGGKDRENLSISLKNNILTRIYNGIEIIDDLNTGIKYIKIAKKHDRKDNTSMVFEALYNENAKLETGALAINTHKGNGKINGTYRFDVSKTKGVRANFYSRKGVKIDLMTNPMLLEKVNTLMLPSNTNGSNDVKDNDIVGNFINSAEENIAKNLNERVVIFDSSNFNMDSVIEAETKIMSIIKEIKGEIPLKGLIERIDHCIAITDNKKKSTSNNKVKTLKLKSNN